MASEGASRRSQTTTSSRGTAGYRAPELIRDGRNSYTNKVDVWSMGCILYELALAKKPFVDDWAVLCYSQRSEPLEFNVDLLTDSSWEHHISRLLRNMLDVTPSTRHPVSLLLRLFTLHRNHGINVEHRLSTSELDALGRAATVCKTVESQESETSTDAPILRLPNLPHEILIEIVERLLRDAGTSAVSSLSMTCQALYRPAVTVLYRCVVFPPERPPTGHHGAETSECDPILFLRGLTTRNGQFVQTLIFTSSFKPHSHEAVQRICDVLRRCPRLRGLCLNGMVIENELLSTKSARVWKWAIFDSPLLRFGLDKDCPYGGITRLTLSAPFIPCRGVERAVLRLFPSLRSLTVSWFSGLVSNCQTSIVLYKETETDISSLVQDILALSEYCPHLQRWQLPFWEVAFRHPRVFRTLKRLTALRELCFASQSPPTNRFESVEVFDIDYVTFRLNIQSKSQIKVTDFENITIINLVSFRNSDATRSQIIFDYLYDRLAPDQLLNLRVSDGDDVSWETLRLLDGYRIEMQQRFICSKRILYTGTFSNFPWLERQLPPVITAVNLTIPEQIDDRKFPSDQYQRWTLDLRHIVRSPTLRALRIDISCKRLVDFLISNSRPRQSALRRFQFCWWRQPVAAPKGSESIRIHQCWSHLLETEFIEHDYHLDLNIENLLLLRWPTAEGDVVVMKDHGMDVDRSRLVESWVIKIAEEAQYVAFHLDLRLTDASEERT